MNTLNCNYSPHNSANNNYNTSAMLTFENVWSYSARPMIVEPIESRVAVSNDNQGMSRKNVTHSIVSTQYRKYYQKWLTKITGKPVFKEPLSTHKRALIAGAGGTLLPGQVTVLTGHSGSGKSVLLRILAGLSPISTGNVWFDNNENERHNIDHTPAIQWRMQVALLAQHPQLIEGSVLDNLQIPYHLHAHHQSHFDIDWHVKQLAYLERTADFLQQSASHLSGGERQLVNTLRLLQLEPQVLLLDEPTAALDPDTSKKLVQLLLNWLRADLRRTLLWVTHDTQDIMSLADQHWHMQAGVLTKVV